VKGARGIEEEAAAAAAAEEEDGVEERGGLGMHAVEVGDYVGM
jgi:hypothetical protein